MKKQRLLIVFLFAVMTLSTIGCEKKIETSEQTNQTESSTQMDTEETIEEMIETKIDTDSITPKEILVDFYLLPEAYSLYLSDADFTNYKKFVDAWLNYEPYVDFDEDYDTLYLWGMIQECFFIVYGDFDEDTGFIKEGDRLYFPYTSANKEEHDTIIESFEKRVQSFFSDIDENEQDIELARHIYINFNQTLTYDYDIVENDNYTFENSSGYSAMMHGSGVCMSFAKAYTYLVRQAGLEAFDISSYDHEWGAINISGKYYFVDPTWDYESKPEDYRYFCFGLEQREQDGYEACSMFLCCNGDFLMTDYITIEQDNYVE